MKLYVETVPCCIYKNREQHISNILCWSLISVLFVIDLLKVCMCHQQNTFMDQAVCLQFDQSLYVLHPKCMFE